MFALFTFRNLERAAHRHSVCNYFPINPVGFKDARDNDLALVLICKNVELDIDEWLRFHTLAGVKHFYVYDNGSQDGTTVKALRNRSDKVSVTVHPWVLRPLAMRSHGLFGGGSKTDIAAQELAYAHAVLNYGSQHKWMSFIDIDEFLIPVQHDTLPEALEQLKNHSNITLPWFNFGYCGHETRPPEPVVYAYGLRHQMSGNEVDTGKCILQPGKITVVGLHAFETTDMQKTTTDDSGSIFHITRNFTKETISNRLIQLNHYSTKSVEEHRQKLKFALHGATLSQRKWSFDRNHIRINRNTCVDSTAMDFLKRRGISNAAEFQQYIDSGSNEQVGRK